MVDTVQALHELLAKLAPELSPEPWAYLALRPGEAVPAEAFALIREEEGDCAVVPLAWAEAEGRPAAFVAARITLRVRSELAATGLTAAVSRRLADAGVACNVIAGLRHDHLLVPWQQREEALSELHATAREVPGAATGSHWA